MDLEPELPARARWPVSARATCAALASIVCVLAVALVVVGSRSTDHPTASAGYTHAGTRPSIGHVQSADVAASAVPAPSIDAEQAMVGPLFRNGLSGDHSCTGTVVASSSGDTVLTAAHCVSGSARGWQFAPGYDKGKTPDGVWTVTGQYATGPWLGHQAPQDDFAVLTVADRTIDGRKATLASVTGAAQLATTPPTRTLIRVIAYNDGRDDAATTCVVPMRRTHGNPTFFCHGFTDGSSGSPWLLADAGAPTIVGIIGGRHQGGCTDFTSHSAVFTSTVAALVRTASQGGKPDDMPSAGGDNCPST